MQSLLFDDSGEVWDAKSPALGEALQASLSADELAKYVVKNLGFIAATEACGSVQIRLRPAVASPTALSAVLYWLYDQTIERVLISFLDEEWTHALVRTVDEAVKALLARVKFNASDREGDFLLQPKPLHDLPDTSPLHAVLAAWSELGGRFNRERLLPLLDRALNGRFVLFENVANSPHVHVKDVGQGFGEFGLVLVDAHQGPARRGSARLCVREMGGRGLSAGPVQARAKPRGRRCGHNLAAAAAHELPLPTPAGAIQGAQLNPDFERDGDRPGRKPAS